MHSLCRVPTHSLPVTPASRLSYLKNLRILSFALPSEAHLLKLHLPGSHHPGFSVRSSLSFTSSSSVYYLSADILPSVFLYVNTFILFFFYRNLLHYLRFIRLIHHVSFLTHYLVCSFHTLYDLSKGCILSVKIRRISYHYKKL